MNTRDQKLLHIVHLLSQERGLSQRDVFLRLGMAQGLVNRYLKLLATKGWIKLTTAPAKRMRYWLTPKGMQEKARLVYEFASVNYLLFREAHRGASNALGELARAGARRIVFVGGGPLAEIAAMSLAENGQRLVGVADDQRVGGSCLGFEIMATPALTKRDQDGILFIDPVPGALARQLGKLCQTRSLQPNKRVR